MPTARETTVLRTPLVLPLLAAAALAAGCGATAYGDSSPAAAREVLDAEARHTEPVMLGVRLSDGFDLRSLPLPARVKAAQMVECGLVDAEGFRDDRVVLTQRGRLLADAVVRDLLTA